MKLVTIFLFACFSSLNIFAQTENFQSGDLIFQTSNSSQSTAIMWASKSKYSHVGIIEIDGSKKYVIEAISKVSRTPLSKWIDRGRLARYTVYRYDGITKEQQKSVIENAKKYLGTGYDLFFTSQNKEIYCSELVNLAYQKTGINVGKSEKVKELNVDNPIVRGLVEKRWRKHPLCISKVKTFEECWKKILEDELISPEGLIKDEHLKMIYSNYPKD